MTESKKEASLLASLDGLNAQQLKRLLVEHLTKQKLGLYWESSSIDRDAALNANIVLPRLVRELCHRPTALGDAPNVNLIIEGDNFDSLRLLRATHAGKIRVIYIDPPYNTGNKDWVYNDRYVGANDRWRHSQWLEFLYQRLSLARDLLTSDGVILVSINDENRAKLEMMMDEVLPGRRLGTITWRTRQGSNADQACFLSVDHEHILVYGNEGFHFNGFDKSYEMYSNADNDPRGDWRTSDLTLGFSYKERPNLYYALADPSTGVVYPPNPDRIWVYASKERLKEGQTVQAKTMEEFIELGQIIFPKEQRISTWNSLEELLAAIDSGDVPKSGKSPILRRDLPNLEQWVGKKIGFGRPAFKRYKADLRNQTQPLSSWVIPTFEDGDYEAEFSFVAGTNQEGARQIADLFGDRAFNYAKPVSLIKSLLKQATQPHDIVLDFFGGSGTTGQAVLELNVEDGGKRRFILCSSTEATEKEPNKNICRDVCAERMRRVAQGYGGRPGFTPEQGGEFAYLVLDKIEAADVAFDATQEHAFALLSLQRIGVAQPVPDGAIKRLGRVNDCDVLMCRDVSLDVIEQLAAWPLLHQVARLAVYSPRPQTVLDQLTARGVQVNCYPLAESLVRGQHAGAAGPIGARYE